MRRCGNKVVIKPEITGASYTSIVWTGSETVSLSGVDSLCFIPILDERIVVEVVTANGCTAIDSLNIDVFVDVSKISAYVPNILNINSDEGNNSIMIDLPPDILELTDFAIYDRWGQMVAFTDRINMGQPVLVWDGTMDNSEVSSGVYVFRYEMLTVYDDIRRERSGDITVIK